MTEQRKGEGNECSENGTETRALFLEICRECIFDPDYGTGRCGRELFRGRILSSNGWFACRTETGRLDPFAGASQSDLFLMAVSMTAAFSYASVFYEEAENRFVLMSLSRTSYKAYIGTKVFVTAFSGGCCVICAFCLQTIFCILAAFSSGEFFGEFMGYLGQHMLLPLLQWAGLAALSGAFWAMAGGISAVVMKSRYMAYMAPFILYYIFSEFQSRYYPELYFLSPREWVASKYLSVGVRYGILTVAVCLAGGVYAAVIRRRVAHV